MPRRFPKVPLENNRKGKIISAREGERIFGETSQKKNITSNEALQILDNCSFLQIYENTFAVVFFPSICPRQARVSENEFLVPQNELELSPKCARLCCWISFGINTNICFNHLF